MAKKTEHLGQESGKSSDRWLSPQQPYTGDGRTTRKTHDPVEVETKTGDQK